MECEYPSCTTSMLPEAYVQHLIDLHGFKGLSNLAKSSREPLPRPSRLNPVTGESDESLSSNSSVSLSKLDERVNAIDEFVSSHFERLQNESPSNEKDRSPFEGNGTAIRDRFLLSGPSDLNMSQPTFRTELKKRNDLYLFDIGSKAEASLMRLLSEYMQHAFAIDGIEILAQCRSATWELMVLPFGPGSGGIWLLDKDLTCMRLAEWSFSRFLSCLKQRGLSDLPHYASWCPTRRESTEELRCWLEDELRHYTSDYFAPYSTKGPEILSRMKARAEDFNEPVNISNALRRFYSL